MALTPGTRLGVYEVTAPIGEGGMGQVYRATDTKLKRQVAIKILPPSLAGDADRLARFQREAEVLASLNHSHIAAIYGLEESAGMTALVMELVEGEDLSHRLARGPVPLDEALAIAKQIAEALEAAHEQNIIHRDLKPANIKVRPDGTVKVLDFGLAKALAPGGASATADASMSPTITTPAMTQAGVILGTAAYMSPEQARGRTVDKRADIWAFGVVLFEMITGKRAFPGEDLTDTLAAVVKLDPPWDVVRTDVPARVRQVLRLCLQKDPRQRAQSIGDVRLALDGAFESAAPPAPALAAETSLPAARFAWIAAAAAVLVAAALVVPAMRHLREAPGLDTPMVNLTMSVAPAEKLGRASFYGRPNRTAFAISPDGATVVFGGETTALNGPPTRMLYRRPFADTRAVAIPGTERAEYPFFSPDGQWVAFGADNKLRKVALSGGPPIDICDFSLAGRIEGGSWGPSGVIVFARQGLWTVSSAGGSPDVLLKFDANTRLLSPDLLPDGKTVVFTEVPSNFKWEAAHVDAIDLSTKQRRTLLTNAADARFSATGHLVFVRSAALLAVPFDATRSAVSGAPVPLLAGVMQSTNAPNSDDETGMGQFALSAAGTLVYAAGDRYPTPAFTLVRVDRKGSESRLAASKGDLYGLRVSASGARAVAFKSNDGSFASDIWMFDLASGTPTRLTSTGDAMFPLFLPDDKSITFVGGGLANGGLYALALNATNAPQRIAEPTERFVAAAWSADGKWLAYLTGDVAQIFVRPVRDGKLDAGEPRPFSPSTFDQFDATFSPDGRWIAYSSNESGTFEVYVQAFPGPGEKHRVSVNGGTNPAWSPNGRELFYLSQSATAARRMALMMAVDIATTSDFKTGVPHVLFEGPYVRSTPLRSYDVTPDGQFIMNRSQEPPPEPVTTLNVVLGWAEELTRKVPTGR